MVRNSDKLEKNGLFDMKTNLIIKISALRAVTASSVEFRTVKLIILVILACVGTFF